METVIDQAGRIVLPKPIRDALDLLPGTKVDISPYGAGVQVVPAGRTARLAEEGGTLVSTSDTRLTMVSSSPSLTLAASDARGRHQGCAGTRHL
jgi:AbrB family looped-hinge helix DNA binding protein